MQLGTGDAENSRAWDNLGKLPWYQPVAALHEQAFALAEHPTDKCAEGKTPQPLVAVRQYGKGQVVYLGFNETWRWRWREDELRFNQFWIQTIRYLCRSKLLGAGRSRLARVLAGAERATRGRLECRGEAAAFRSPADAIGRGIGLLPEDRKAEGLVALLTVARNVALPHGRRLAPWGLLPSKSEERLAELRALGVDVYRFTLRWDHVQPARGSFDWSWPDAVVDGLSANGITPIVTIWGTPAWANRGRGPSYAPSSKWTLAAFAKRAAARYEGRVRHWVIWNEPNQRRWLRPTTPGKYVALLNAAYAAIKRADRTATVAGGVTAPRGNTGGMNPVQWIREMARLRAKLDAYAHHPYPANPLETPWAGGCSWCKTITMADLDRLIREVRRNFPRKRIWLTEYGYQTNPPERWLGVPPARQALYASAASLRAHQAPLVDMLIHFLVQDDGRSAGWQSGLRRLNGAIKPAYNAFKLPLAQVARTGSRTVVWGQVRPRSGRQPYRLQQWRNGGWRWVGGLRMTGSRGFFQLTVRASKGSKLRLWSPRDGVFSPPLQVR